MAEAIAEAKRCLNCKVPQCRKGCPVENDIPAWIHELSMGNLGNAMNIINTRSNLPAVCGRVCAHERQCEGHCILGKKGTHIHIGKLERFVADFDSEMHLSRSLIVQKSHGRVAVIGSGPSGLTVAGELARKGFNVEIFEMEKSAGGVLKFGIPEYRLPKAVVNSEIAKIEQLGVKFNFGVTVGLDVTIDELFAQGFDAIYVGTGTGKPNALPIKGIESDCVEQAILFLRRVGLYNAGLIDRKEIPVEEGDIVYVIGCGNTAMDASRTALRFGAAEVNVVYHKDQEQMTALKAEYDDAVAEGVNFMWNASITAILPNQDKRYSIIIEKDGGFTNKTADRIILAVGSRPASRIISTTEGIEINDKGFVVMREYPFGMTTRKGVFAGGDVSGNQATVVHAMANARAVAESIASYVDAVSLLRAVDEKQG